MLHNPVYCIYRQSGTSTTWKKVKTMISGSSVNWTDPNVSNGTTYRYRVRAYCGQTLGAYKGSKSVYRLTRTSISSVKNKAPQKLSLSWKKNSKATGYQIQYSTKSDFSSCKTVTVKSCKTVQKTLSKLTRKKNYYIRVRCYKNCDGSKYYSAWSTRKSVKIRQ